MRLEVKKLSKTFNGHVGLKDASFEIPDCRTIAVLGASGSGKSTLIRLLAGLEIPEEGSIAVDGNLIVFEESFLLPYRKTIGVVFQSYNLFPHLTLLQNIKLPLQRVHGLTPQAATVKAMEYLTRFGLNEHAMKKPYELSGGQRQRASIVRAVATNVQTLLFDEPTSALDPLMTSEVLDLILELQKEGKGIILVSHNMGFVKKIADWVVFLDKGTVLEAAPTQQFFSAPMTEQAQRYVEKVLKY